MNRLQRLFNKKKKKLIPFLVADYPTRRIFWETVLRLDDTVCDALEIGIPFSDPVADGEVIQSCYQDVLQRGFQLTEFLDQLYSLRRYVRLPLIVMSYLNPLLQFGLKSFAGKATRSLVEAMLIVDLPAEESRHFWRVINGSGLNRILLVAPSTSEERIRYISRHSVPFVYLVSHYGVTGSAFEVNADFINFLERVRRNCKKPVCLGFGIASGKQARQISPLVDGVIVGSALLSIFRSGGKTDDLYNFLLELREVL